MTFGDMQSLFQLGTALNLAFGGFLAFGEPIKQQIRKAVANDESALQELIETRNNEPADIEAIFQISRSYVRFRVTYTNTLRQWDAIDQYPLHFVFISLCLISFVMLVVCAYLAQVQTSGAWILLAVVCNAIPIAIACAQFALAVELRFRVYPALIEFQSLIRSLPIKHLHQAG